MRGTRASDAAVAAGGARAKTGCCIAVVEWTGLNQAVCSCEGTVQAWHDTRGVVRRERGVRR